MIKNKQKLDFNVDMKEAKDDMYDYKKSKFCLKPKK